MGKRKVFFQGKACQDKISQTHKVITIGVMGTSFGVGASHLSFLLASYFIKIRNKIAVVEWGKQDTYIYIENAYEGKAMDHKATSFKYKKATFYKNFLGTISTIKDSGYAFVIVDFGPHNSRHMDVFNDMDVKIIVGHCNEWKSEEIHELYDRYDSQITKNWNLVIPFGTKEEANLIQREIRKKPFILGFYKDPFIWNKTLKDEVEAILGM